MPSLRKIVIRFGAFSSHVAYRRDAAAAWGAYRDAVAAHAARDDIQKLARRAYEAWNKGIAYEDSQLSWLSFAKLKSDREKVWTALKRYLRRYKLQSFELSEQTTSGDVKRIEKEGPWFGKLTTDLNAAFGFEGKRSLRILRRGKDRMDGKSQEWDDIEEVQTWEASKGLVWNDEAVSGLQSEAEEEDSG